MTAPRWMHTPGSSMKPPRHWPLPPISKTAGRPAIGGGCALGNTTSSSFLAPRPAPPLPYACFHPRIAVSGEAGAVVARAGGCSLGPEEHTSQGISGVVGGNTRAPPPHLGGRVTGSGGGESGIGGVLAGHRRFASPASDLIRRVFTHCQLAFIRSGRYGPGGGRCSKARDGRRCSKDVFSVWRTKEQSPIFTQAMEL
jgi:hypothetical protein